MKVEKGEVRSEDDSHVCGSPTVVKADQAAGADRATLVVLRLGIPHVLKRRV